VSKIEEYITLVNEDDQVLGKEEKLTAHIEGKQHRAFSILIVNDNKEMLIHKRESSKYHSGGLWTNACCSHPAFNEELLEAAHRRLTEEMGFDCPLTEVFSFKYYHAFDNGLIENEYDHVFVGLYNEEEIQPNPVEVEDYQWVDYELLLEDMAENKNAYTVWFQKIINKLKTNEINIFEVY
jgi:isopentenyl-diphosphate delta-isomerase